MHIYTKTTTNVHDWSGARVNFAVVGDNHDSLPVAMPDDAFVVFFSRATGGTYDIAFRRSSDGTNWAPAVAVTDTLTADDVEPHPLLVGTPDYVELYWGRDDPAGSFTYDIVREPIVPVNDILFADGFEGRFRAEAVARAAALLSSDAPASWQAPDALAGRVRRARRARLQPHSGRARGLSDLDTPLSVYLKLADAPYAYLFESVEGGENWGRYSIIGLPCATRYGSAETRCRSRSSAKSSRRASSTIRSARSKRSARRTRCRKLAGLPAFTGGLVGYFGFEASRGSSRSSPRAKRPTSSARRTPC